MEIVRRKEKAKNFNVYQLLIKRYRMEHDEHEMLVEYSEMTAFNFNSKEYKEVKSDFIECKEKVSGMEGFFKSLLKRMTFQAV